MPQSTVPLPLSCSHQQACQGGFHLPWQHTPLSSRPGIYLQPSPSREHFAGLLMPWAGCPAAWIPPSTGVGQCQGAQLCRDKELWGFVRAKRGILASTEVGRGIFVVGATWIGFWERPYFVLDMQAFSQYHFRYVTLFFFFIWIWASIPVKQSTCANAQL